MRADNRLTRMLHVLIHMDVHDGRATSDTIAQMLSTNPVVVRRTMAGLRDAGYVQSEKGHGGGWVLARKLSDLTVLDIYQALGAPSVFAIAAAADHPKCLVERTVNAAIEDALHQAGATLLGRFGEVKLSQLAAEAIACGQKR